MFPLVFFLMLNISQQLAEHIPLHTIFFLKNYYPLITAQYHCESFFKAKFPLRFSWRTRLESSSCLICAQSTVLNVLYKNDSYIVFRKLEVVTTSQSCGSCKAPLNCFSRHPNNSIHETVLAQQVLKYISGDKDFRWKYYSAFE